MKPTKDIAREIAHNFKTTDGWTVVVYQRQTLEDIITAALDAERSKVEGLVEALEEIRNRGWATEDHDTRKNLADVADDALKKLRGEG